APRPRPRRGDAPPRRRRVSTQDGVARTRPGPRELGGPAMRPPRFTQLGGPYAAPPRSTKLEASNAGPASGAAGFAGRSARSEPQASEVHKDAPEAWQVGRPAGLEGPRSDAPAPAPPTTGALP